MCLLSKPVFSQCADPVGNVIVQQGPDAHIVPQSRHKKSNNMSGLESVNIISWNVNTLAKDESLTWIFGTMDSYRPNVICFQETRLTSEQVDGLSISGFKLFHTPASSSKPRIGENRGLITAVSLDLIYDEAYPSDRLSMGEGVETLSVRIHGNKGHITIHNVYVHQETPPSSLHFNLSQGRHAIVGDFNARHTEWEPNSEIYSPRGKALHSLILDSQNLVLANIPKVPTTIHGTTLSLSIVSAELAANTDWQVLEGSPAAPHMPTLTSMQFDPPSSYPQFKPRLLYRKADWNKFYSLSEEAAPMNTSEPLALENRLTRFVTTALKSASQAIPSTKSHDKVAPWDCWWFTEECREAKSKLHKTVKAFMDKQNVSRSALRKVRAETLATYSKAKSEEWNRICQEINLNTSISSQWRRLRWLYNGGTPPKPSLLADPQTQANKSMSFFSERTKLSNLNYAAQRMHEELQEKREFVIKHAINSPDPLDAPFTLQELSEALKPIKNSTPGNDDISFLILAHMGPKLRSELLTLIIQSWELRRLPNQWKLVPIIPIPKKDPGEFRPIALLSCIDKIMERMVLARLKYQVGPFHPNLVGGVSGRGTTDAIATVAKLASDARHRRSGPTTNALYHCFALFIDFEKAFELANSSAILYILASEKGVKGNMLAWLKDYLEGRKGYTIVQGVESDPLPLENGTPQGSVLSPFLFNILIDNLLQTIELQCGQDMVPKVTTIAYADDIVLVSNHAYAPTLLNKASYSLELAANILGLKINVKKTKAMAWTHSHYLPDFCFTIYGKSVEWVRVFRYLGVIFDDQLSFIPHAKAIVASAQKRINILKHMAGSPYGATQSTLLRYVKACIRPVLEYGSIVHPIARISALKALEVVQNAALRIALRLPKHTPISLLRAESGLTSLIERAQYLAVVAYSKIKAQAPHHPFFHQNKQMHMDLYMFSNPHKRKNDVPLDIALENLTSRFDVPILESTDVPLTCPFEKPMSSYINFNITPLPKPKEAYTSSQLQDLAKEIENLLNLLYPHQQHVYVDGSVDMESGRAASAFVFQTKTDTEPCAATYRVPDWVSSTQAELGAIFKVLECILTKPCYRNIVIICDSMSALQTLQAKPDPLDSLTVDILKLAKYLVSNRNVHISMHWVPSHIGIIYNEIVDDWAKKGTLKKEIDFLYHQQWDRSNQISRGV